MSDSLGARFSTFLLATATVTVVIAMIFDPELAFRSAVRGLEIWWHVVFPALLPFFIGGQVLMGIGVVHFMGVLMEPAMKPLFNVPGAGSFVIAMGLASGYPIGAVLTARLRKDNLVTREEAERLISFANTADPLFMAGAVAVGMFGNAALSGLIMISHYLGALITGFLFRFYRRGAPVTPSLQDEKGFILTRAFNALWEARRRDGRPFGKLLGEAVEVSADTLMLIGGFIILFSVIIQMLRHTGVVEWVASLLALPLGPLGVDPTTLPGLVNGIMEITIGTQTVADAEASLLQRVMIAGAIIAWSGLSVFGQVAAIVQGTDIRLLPYLVARGIHALVSAMITVLLFNPVNHLATVPAGGRVAVPLQSLSPGSVLHTSGTWWSRLALSTAWFLIATAVIISVSLAIAFIRHQAPRRT